MGIFIKKNDYGDYELNKGAAAGAALASLVSLGVVADGMVFTSPNETKLVLTAGKPERFAPEGISFKIPFYQSVYGVTTSVRELGLSPASIALQNGTVTAENLESSVFIQLNGTRAERERTVSLLRERMPDYEERIRTLAETELRNIVRLTVIASEDAGEVQQVTSTRDGAQINFLDTKRVSEQITKKLQEQLSSIIPGTVEMAGKQVPAIEVTEFRIGDFKFDEDYLSRRKNIADARANAEAARFEKAEAERKAEARAAQAEGERRATVTTAQGEAEATKLRKNADAEGLKALVEAAGGPDKLREQTLADKWDGKTPQVVGGSGVIVDGRFAPGVQKDITAPLSGPSNDR